MSGMSGRFEYLAEMSHIINHSRKQQRSVTITLIDLKNAFGEVHHSLIKSVLRFHHIPEEINCIVKLLYSDFRLSIITNDFYTNYIAVQKGVLQGDLISNFHKHLYTMDQNFRYRTFKGFLPRNWIHTVVVTSLECEKSDFI